MHAAATPLAPALEHRHPGDCSSSFHLQNKSDYISLQSAALPRGFYHDLILQLNQNADDAEIRLCFRVFTHRPLVRGCSSPLAGRFSTSSAQTFCDLRFRTAADGQRLVMGPASTILLKGCRRSGSTNMNPCGGLERADGFA